MLGVMLHVGLFVIVLQIGRQTAQGKGVAHVRRHRRLGAHRRLAVLKGHDNGAGVEMERRRSFVPAIVPGMTVNRIAEQRPAHGPRMNANLMRATRVRREFHQGQSLVCAATNPSPAGSGRQALRIGTHPPAAGRVETAKRQIDLPFVLLRLALDNGPIGLGDPSRLEEFA